MERNVNGNDIYADGSAESRNHNKNTQNKNTTNKNNRQPGKSVAPPKG